MNITVLPYFWWYHSPIAFCIVMFIAGAMIGSFINVVAYRLPIIQKAQRHGNTLPFTLWGPRSICPTCSNTLTWYHNIPLLSYVFLGGRCGFCRTPISWRYPAVETLCGALALLSATTIESQPLAILVAAFCLLSVTNTLLFLNERSHSKFLLGAQVILLGAILWGA